MLLLCSQFIMLCLGSTEMDGVMRELCYKGILVIKGQLNKGMIV